MADKVSLELQVKGLEKNMAAIIKAFKGFKVSMDALEKKVNKHQEEEIKELIKTQKMLNDIVVSNSEAIKQIDIEIKRLENEREAVKVDSKKDEDDIRAIEAKKCKYYNRGYCKYKFKCKFVHPGESCKTYLEGKRCDEKNCEDRHPKVCKWWLKGGCRGRNCDYLLYMMMTNKMRHTKTFLVMGVRIAMMIGPVMFSTWFSTQQSFFV